MRGQVSRCSPPRDPNDRLTTRHAHATCARLDRGGAVRRPADGRRRGDPGPARSVAAQPRLRIRRRADGTDPAARCLLSRPGCAGDRREADARRHSRAARASCRRHHAERVRAELFVSDADQRQGPADAGRSAAHRAVPPRQPRLLQDDADQDARRTRVHRRRHRRSAAGRGRQQAFRRDADARPRPDRPDPHPQQPAAADDRRRRGRCVGCHRDRGRRSRRCMCRGRRTTTSACRSRS